MTQNARVALWVPPEDNAAGDAIVSEAVPGVGKVINTRFGPSAATGGVAFASDAEMKTGTEALKATSPATTRTELVRLTAIPAVAMTAGAIAVAAGGAAAQANMLVKTNSSGMLDPSFVPSVFDGGTF